MPQTILSTGTADRQLHLLKTGVFSDFKIVCQNHEFKVHRAIPCPNSTYFSKEGAEGAVNLAEDDPTIISRILHYQYTKGYDAEDVPVIGMQKAIHQTESIVIDSELRDQNAAAGYGVVATPKSYTTKAGLKVTIDQARKHLAIHAEVHACVDRLGIEKSKEYACSRFMDLAGDEDMILYHQRYYGHLRNFIYENTMMESMVSTKTGEGGHGTSRASSGLRYEATMCAVRNLHMLHAEGSIRQVIKEHEPMAWEVAVILRQKGKSWRKPSLACNLLTIRKFWRRSHTRWKLFWSC